MPNRLEREIEEILSRLQDFPPKRSFKARIRLAVLRAFRAVWEGVTTLPRPRISLGQLMLLGGALLLIAYIGLGSGSLSRILMAAGLAIFFFAFVLSLRRQSRITDKRWRGQPMELSGPRLGDRLRGWWERWRSRR